MIYRHPSLGNRIQLAVVKLIILKEDESFAPKNKERISASEMLKAFCLWQNQLLVQLTSNGKHANGNGVFDVALLLTRYLKQLDLICSGICVFHKIIYGKVNKFFLIFIEKISVVIQLYQARIVIH